MELSKKINIISDYERVKNICKVELGKILEIKLYIFIKFYCIVYNKKHDRYLNVDCKHCRRSIGCINCNHCRLCVGCINCNYCEQVMMCINCLDCECIAESINCFNCEYCARCSNCKDCDHCYYLTFCIRLNYVEHNDNLASKDYFKIIFITFCSYKSKIIN